MVSLQTALSSKEGKVFHGLANSSKKRKSRDSDEGDVDDFMKASKHDVSSHIVDVDFHLETPLPLEWQRCLDIQSGEIHFYNTRTHKRTSRDPRLRSPSPPRLLCLDLELNLNFESSPTIHASHAEEEDHREMMRDDSFTQMGDSRLLQPPSLVEDGRRGEMVAAVCMRCHMLVMLCKSAPSCPNCKFMHPRSERSLPELRKPGFRLLCCKD
ncbi:hypothetical protein QJS04_geneDACA019664 [Acorus gramineus]|uniref:WW domain-containing protein n=1 Tax=Acorus gramineus TaxID=55184 RepID=A0AAV9BP84_ACOGR|nr:hypothetical protein QJS04_geneDACA019664 [Acorus gramineus]